MRHWAGVIMGFLVGALTVRNLWRDSDLILSAALAGPAATMAAAPFSEGSSSENSSRSVEEINSLKQRMHQLTEALARVNASFYETLQQEKEHDESSRNQQQRMQHQLDEAFARMNASFHETMQQQKKMQNPQQERQQLPQCDEVMQAPNSRFKDGAFITSFTTPIQWTLRSDGSRQVDLNNHICHLKRYTAAEAKMCLASQHVSFIGDSLTRYQYLNLAYFLEHDTFPPRFGNFRQPCTHYNESGHQTCSPPDQPNICMETDWRFRVPKEFENDEWMYFFASLGGYSEEDASGGGIMNGHMECSCARAGKMTCGSACSTENQLYMNGKSQTTVSYFKEDGWGDAPNPLHGFYFSNCSQAGKCRQTYPDNQRNVDRAIAMDFDWSQPFPEAINTSGVFRRTNSAVGSNDDNKGEAAGVILPSQPNVVIYNRGLWGELSKARAQTIMPVLYDFVHQHDTTAAGGGAGGGTDDNSNGNGNRCFYKTTTASSRELRDNYFEHELKEVRPSVHQAGCHYLDYAHLTKPFAAMAELKDWREAGERGAIYWDAVHFMPWVYEELNQVLLNVLCNSQKLSTTTTSQA